MPRYERASSVAKHICASNRTCKKDQNKIASTAASSIVYQHADRSTNTPKTEKTPAFLDLESHTQNLTESINYCLIKGFNQGEKLRNKSKESFEIIDKKIDELLTARKNIQDLIDDLCDANADMAYIETRLQDMETNVLKPVIPKHH